MVVLLHSAEPVSWKLLLNYATPNSTAVQKHLIFMLVLGMYSSKPVEMVQIKFVHIIYFTLVDPFRCHSL